MALPPPRPDVDGVSYEPVGEPIDMARHHSARTKDRKQALDILFESDLRSRPVTASVAAFTSETSTPLRGYASEIALGVDENLEAIDSRLSSCLTGGWTLDRMPRVDRCLARIATWEIDYGTIPAPVAISEAVGLAGELSTEESANFLNGLLKAVGNSKASS